MREVETKALLAILLAAHGAIHLIGFAKAFGIADVPQAQADEYNVGAESPRMSKRAALTQHVARTE